MHRPRILIVEDEFLVAYEVRMNLEEHGFEVCGMVGSGEEAVAAARQGRPHCVLMDVSLKGAMGGIEAARRIAARQRVPIVFMTGLPCAQIMEQARDLEPVACLAKPLDEAELCRVIDTLVARGTPGRVMPTEMPAAAPDPSSMAGDAGQRA